MQLTLFAVLLPLAHSFLTPIFLSSRSCRGYSSGLCGPRLPLREYQHTSASPIISFARHQRRYSTQLEMSVDVTAQDLPNSQKKLEILVSADECTKAYEKVIFKLAKDTTIPGFRKGKAPAAMVVKHFGEKSVSADVCQEIIGAAVPVALQQKDIKAIGQARMADEQAISRMLESFAPGQAVKFEVLVDVWPQPKLTGPYIGQTVEAEEEAFEEDLVNKALAEMRKREAMAVISGAETQAALQGELSGDAEARAEGVVVVVDLNGFRRNPDGSKGDKLPDLAVGENVEVVMESGKFFEGFVERLVGMRAGDATMVPITFPANHKVPDLRGVEAVFDVTIKGLKDKIFPALDDDFAQRVSNGDSKTMADLRKKVRDNISQDSLVSTTRNVNKALEDMVMKLVDVDVPETLVDEQTKGKFANMMSDFKLKGMADEAVKSIITKVPADDFVAFIRVTRVGVQENFDKYKAKTRPNTIRGLQVSFGIGEIAKREGIKVDPQEVEGQIALLRQQFQKDEVDEEQARSRVEAELERQKVLEFLKQKNTVKLIPKKAAEET